MSFLADSLVSSRKLHKACLCNERLILTDEGFKVCNRSFLRFVVTIPPKTPKRRRKRGVILTKVGLARFQAVKANAEYEQNQGHRYTLEALSEKAGVSVDTLAKVLACEVRVDKQTLKCCFEAFALELGQDDYYSPEAVRSPELNPARSATGHAMADRPFNQLPYPVQPPGGQIPVDSPYYISRLKAEATSYQAMTQPGALIRLKGAHQTGKTSLIAKISQQAQQRGYQPVYISFQLAENAVLQDLDKLLQWFCASVGLNLSISPSLDTYWNPIFGSKMSCKLYFEEYLLPTVQKPVVLLLDDIERLFNNTDVADEFFGLLRTCYEEAKTSQIWQQLKVVIAQTSEVYIPLNINKSPFNVGVAVPLLPFEPSHLQALASAYQLNWSLADVTALCQLLSGQPYLSHLVVYHVWKRDVTIADVLAQGAECPIFLSYLHRQQRQVQQTPTLGIALGQLFSQATSFSPTVLADIYRLQSLGLVTLTDSGPKIACQLLQDYFSMALERTAAS